jgi:large subunit ribosomal protein L9
VKGVGRRGDVVTVKDGYARNYLLPTGAALVATDSMETQSAAMRKSRDLQDAHDRSAAETQRKAIESGTVTIAARAGATGRLFGSVTEADVAAAIATQTGAQVTKDQIEMTEHLKDVGTATATVHIFEGVSATVNLEVVAKA